MDISNIQLLFDNVLIKPDEQQKQSEGGLIDPSANNRKPITGTVMAVGIGVQAPDTGIPIEMQVEAGDKVVYDNFQAVPYLNTGYLILEQSFIKSKIKQ